MHNGSATTANTMLKRQKYAADRSHHYHFLARLRVQQGYCGAAIFYQGQAARWHQRACEYREQWLRLAYFVDADVAGIIADAQREMSENFDKLLAANVAKLAMSSAYGRIGNSDRLDAILAEYCAICECRNGHSLNCATFKFNNTLELQANLNA